MATLTKSLLILATILGLAACTDGKTVGGYDGDSPAGEQVDWCSQSPPSGYCNIPDSR